MNQKNKNYTMMKRYSRKALITLALLTSGASGVMAQTTAHATGVDGTTVYLNDLEDHSWSYYSDASCPIRSLNPADVTITYYGNGQNDNNMTTTDAGDTPTSFGAKATGVQVGPSDAANTFVYYKTLERANADGSGNLAYTTIPNPFQVRPTGTSGSVTPTTRTVYISWTCNTWYYSQYAQVYFTYTNDSGTQVTSSTYTSNGNTTITAKTGTTITLYARGSRGRTSGTYNPTVTAKYDDNNGSTIVSCQSSGTSYTDNSGNVASTTITVSADRGFYAWRIKSLSDGLTIVGKAVGSIVEAEEEINFVTEKATGNEVEFEALWAQAYVTTGSDNMSTFVPAGVTSAYERNFHVVNTSTAANNFQKSYPCTVIGREPNSTTLNNTRTITGGFTAAADTKFEDVEFGNATNSTWTAANYDLIVGRGCTGTVNYISGVNANVTSPNYTLRLESGTFNYLSFIRGYSDTGGNAQDTPNYGSYTIGGTPNIKGVLGCDYDRATNSGITDNLIINNGAYYGYSVSEANGIAYSDKALVVRVKSGKIGKSFTIDGSSYTADAAQAFYIGIAAQRVRGHRQLFMEGGEVASLAGGIDATGNQNNNSVTFRISGGHIRGAVYGGAARSAAYGNRNIIVTGGTITGWIGGGCNGEAYPAGQDSEDTYGGITNGLARVYFGGNAICGGTGSNVNVNGSVGGIVFGAGKGVEGNTTSGRMSQGTTVVVADACDIERNVYGGGNFGYAQTSTDVYVSGGTVHGSVFGGSNQNNGPVVNVTMKGGTVEGDVYGGSNQSGNITGAVNVKVYGGTVQGAVYGCNNAGGAPQSTVNVDIYGTDDHPSTGYAIGAVYGGGNQANYTYANGPVVTIHGNCTADCADISIGEVYGGGNQATVQKTTVDVYGGNVIGDVYAGANRANVLGTATLNVYGGTIKRVFPGNNNNGTISGTVSTNIDAGTVESGSTHCPMQIGAVFGGGNAVASAARTVNIVCTGDQTEGIDTIFGGANQANITSDITLNISRGHIRKGIYGGNNTSGQVQGNITVNVTNDGTCGFDYPSIFGGGFGESTSSTGNVLVNIGAADNKNTAPTVVGDIYGGSALGSVNTNASNKTIVNILNGTVNGNIYGGGLGRKADSANGITAVAAKVNGVVTVNVSSSTQTADNCAIDLHQASIYGCNNANGSPQDDVTVNIYKTAHDAKNVASYTGDDATYAIDQVFGGGNQADYAPENGSASSTKKATVRIYGCENTIRRVFGGGNAAAAIGVVTTIDGGRFDYIFGGGNGEAIAANIGAGGTNLTVNSGVINHLFGGSNERGNIEGPMRVAIDNTGCTEDIKEFFGGGNLAVIGSEENPVNLTTTIACGTVFGAIYGGSNLADIYGDVTLTINGGTIGEVYGGSKGRLADNSDPSNPIAAKAANIYGKTTLNIYAGAIGNAFGGSNINGNISGGITVNMDWSQSDCSEKSINNIYGGSNLAAYTPTTAGSYPEVNIKHGTVAHSVFGGGKGETAIVTSNPVVTIGDNVAEHSAVVTENVYGGGDAAAVTGNTSVIYNDANTSSTVTKLFGGGNAASVSGTSSVTLTSGKVSDGVYGGCNANGSVGDVTVTLNGGTVGTTSKSADVYGGGFGSATTTSGNINVTLNGTTVYGDLYGGSALGSVNTDGANPANTTTLTISSNTLHGTIYGGGKGDLASYGEGHNDQTATNNGDVFINYNAANTNLAGLYGGANINGLVKGNIEVNVNANVGASGNKVNVFGGGLGQNTDTNGNIDVNVGPADHSITPVIYGDVYGGSALGSVNSGTDDYTHVTLNAGTIYGDAYGGGLGNDTIAAMVNGNVKVTQNGVAFVKATLNDNGNEVVTAGRIFGCNNLNGSPQGTVLVLVNKTSDAPTLGTYDMNAVYGGGNLAAYEPAATTLTATGQFTEYTDKEGNTVARALSNSPLQVVINGCNNVSIEYVYGGGNAAPTPSTDVLVLGAKEIGYVFGGGNGKDRYTLDGGTTWNTNPGADVGVKKNGSAYGTGNANSSLYGGLIHEAYGASNQKGTIKGSITLDVQEGETDCNLTVEKIVGAGKNADVDGDIIMVMGCMPADRKTDEVFGGADNANVNGNVELTITSGTFGKVFGGNNLGGIIKGHIKVNIEETGCNPIKIDELYLGGNQAAYSIFGYNDDGTCKTEGTAIYAQPVLNVISCTRIGAVFGGGLGVGAAMYADPTVNINMLKGEYGDTIPTDNGNNPNHLGRVENVYGGGNQAAVYGNTTVNIGTKIGQNIVLTSPEADSEAARTKTVLGAYITGTVYGAGKGLADTPEAAIVEGNTLVNMAGGLVSRSIYGGGELSSVGKFTAYYAAGEDSLHVEGEPKSCEPGYGLTKVLISGGQVGLNQARMPDPSNPTSDDDYGYVFCASKGLTSGDNIANKLAVSDSSYLEISGTALITGSIYGGSENGQVLRNTYVKIVGGQIGTGYDSATGTWDGAYTDTQWTTAINKVKAGTFADADAAGFHECDAWPFNAEGSRYVYDYYAQYKDGDEYYYDAAHTQPSNHGSNSAGNGHSFYGNVFGGGSGFYPYAAGEWRRSAGRVCGNTLVEITGGHVLTNVYGGNEITDVIGTSKVVMSGGTVGVPRTLAGIKARPVNCYIFGAGMGDPRTLFNGWSNVASSEVVVSDSAVVFGSIFGGGEDGHVLGDAKTTVKGNAVIGTFGSSGVDGNIFGSGRGFSALALTAGVVCGNVTVNIQDQVKILGSVFGGGRLAAVGTYLAAETDTNHYGILQDGDDHGNVTINITGGTIGNQKQMATSGYSIGDVFGGSKGAILDDWKKNQALGLVKNTTVNISQAEDSTTIYGNVYGGGEIASVGSYIYATAEQAAAYSAAHAPEEMTAGDVYAMRDENTGLAVINITGGTIGQNSLSDKKGSVFGGCLGKSGTEYSGYSFVKNAQVTLNGGTVYGCVFGGGENGHVYKDTDVKIISGTVGIPLDNVAAVDSNMIYRGNVYGGGRGVDKTALNDYSLTAGKVNGNTNVTVEGGTIYRCVYGGGSLASVGMRNEPVSDTTNGIATVTIKGGKIGTDGGASANDYTTLIPTRTAEKENGYVYGSGRGMAAGADPNATVVNMAFTRFTKVSIEGDAHVTGSVFGGGENGHVKYDTKVYVKENCLVGTELTAQEHNIDDNGRGRLIYRANVYGGGRGLDTGGDDKYSLTAGRVYGNTLVEVTGGTIYHDVFGGGSLASVGNETVDSSTGEVTYGDDSGLTKVYIKGGIVGYSETDSLQGFNCGFVYGGCRGLAAEPSSDIVKMAYVHNAEVYVDSVADIKGSVFGGGANGHVKNNTKVVISGGSIGTPLKASEVGFDDHGVANAPVFRGNVYAGGRGVDMYQKSGDESYSMTAGAVYGNAELLMTGGHVWHNVYGSGAMASVGTVEAKPAGIHVHDEIVDGNTIVNPDSVVNYLTGVFKQNTGKVTVTITGGTVGDTTSGHEGRNNGRVYGAGRGVSANRSDLVASMEYVNETFVNIGTEGQTSYTAGTDAPYIYGAVFGGGENGHVKKDTHVNIYSGIIGWPLDEGNTGQHKTATDGSSKNPFRGHVFGGGRGVDPLYHSSTETRSSTAGRVYGHTYVTMKGGVVRRAIYGGGLLASVGLYRLAASDLHIIDKIEDENEVDGGDATINISGGYIGNVDANGNALSGTGTSGYALLPPGDNNGHVFGSSCGMVADNFQQDGVAVDLQYRQMGYSHSTHVNISGGHMFGSIFGSGENGHVWEDSRINISGGEIGFETSDLIYTGNVYGSGRGVDHPHAQVSETAGKVRGNTTVNMTGGTVWRDVYGGGSLASVGEADETAHDSKKNPTDNALTNNPFPYSTGLTRVVIDSLSVVHGSVYGSGRGVASPNEAYKQAAYVKNTLVTVKGGAHVYQNVFGGGNAGHVRRNTNVNIDSLAKIDGNVYGGGAGALISSTAGLVDHDVEVNIRGGIIAGDVYGGGAIANTNVHDKRNNPSLYPAKASAYGEPEEDVFAKTNVNLLGGIILGDAYGGGQGVIPADTATAAEKANAGALVRGDVTVTLNGTAFYPTTTTDDQGNIIAASGRVFGCNNLNGTPQGTVLVHVLQTKGLTKSGDTYTVNTNKPERDTDTYELEAVYGGGNLAGYDPWDDKADGQFTSYTYSEGTVAHDATEKPLQVVIDSCDVTSINYVYGGGNAAAAPSTDVVVIGAYEIGNVFGGGNGKDRINKSGNTWTDNPGADVGYLDGTTSYGTGNALANVLGGTVHYAFGGSNTLGNVRNNAKVFIDQASDCPLNISEVYGGGNEAYMEGNSEIELGCISALKDLYGGARNADVNGNITLTISSGTFERVFGGNNLGGKINGAITVNIEETGCHPIIIGEIYAGGNQAPYSIYGYTEKRDASNNIVTDANGKTVWEVKTSTEGTPYADPQVNAKSFTSIGTIYGGGFGESAVMAANPHVNVNVVEHADTEAQTTGEYAGETKTIGGHQVTLPSHEKNKIGAIQTIFGGGNAAKVIGNTFVNVGTLDTVDYVSLFKGEAAARTGLTVKGADIRGNVYGGGNAAEVTGNTNVQIGQ